MVDQFVLDVVPGAWPMTERELEELRWYLEDYLRAPFGVHEERGAEVTASVPDWGARIFTAAFASEEIRARYRRARAGPGHPRLLVRSAEPAWLGLPWELLRDPDSPTADVLDGVELLRTLPGLDDQETVVRPPGSRLRLLIVIARPEGTADVAYRTIARPLMRTLSQVRDQVDVVVLRPPTVEALERALAAATTAGEPFHIVHFDGHGYQPGEHVRASAAEFFGPMEAATVVFEGTDGGAHHVSAETLGRVLGDAGTPLVILNACRSATIGTHLEAGVATRLLAAGVSSVVAMAFSVYAAAAAGFTAALYAGLFAGQSVAAAVVSGRRHLFRENRRPSPRGPLPLEDWMVPVHYVRRNVVFPELRPEAGERLRVEEPAGFVGRDDLFYEIEAGLSRSEVILLRGPAGVGKTELARAFTEWSVDSGLVRDASRVVWHSTVPGAVTFGLDGILTGLGIRLLGPDFAVSPPAERRATVLDACAADPAVFVWDNVETADGGSTDTGAEGIRGFLTDLAATGSVVLLTSRGAERWLGDLRRLTVTGLAPEEADQYADLLTAGSPAARAHRADPAYAALTTWLNGHPLAMRTVLPHLATTPPGELLADLRELDGRFAEPDGPLTAGLAYSVGRLDAQVRTALSAVSLLRTNADPALLSFLSENSTSSRFAGLDVEQWTRHLDAAVDAGLAGPPVDGWSYPLHPVLVGHLRVAWRAEDPDGFAAEEAAAAESMLEACATACEYAWWKIGEGGAAFAYQLLDRNQHSFGHYLALALETGRWEAAYSMFRALNARWETLGLGADAERWIDRITTTMDGNRSVSGEILVDGAARLRMLAERRRALRAVARGDLDEAERISRELVTTAQAQPASKSRDGALAIYFHDLGMIAHERLRWDEAEDWFRKSVALDEAIGELRGASSGHLMLGNLEVGRGRPDRAETAFRRCVELNAAESGDGGLRAAAEHGLGTVAQLRGDLDGAEVFYLRALIAAESTGDRSQMASTLHQLGSVATQRNRPDEAEEWLVRALGIAEGLGAPDHLQSVYGTLGDVARQRGHRDQAERWYRKALDVSLSVGDQDTAVTGYLNLGSLFRADGALDEAEAHARLALTTAEAIGDRTGASVALSELGSVAQRRARFDEAVGFFQQALAIIDTQRNRGDAAKIHHRLAEIAEARDRTEDTVREYKRAFTLRREAGELAAAGETASLLANVLLRAGDPAGADRWARLGYQDATAAGAADSVTFTASLVGYLAGRRDDTAGQLEWYVRAVAPFDRFPHPATGKIPEEIRRLAAALGVAALERAWREVTGDPLPGAVRRYLQLG